MLCAAGPGFDLHAVGCAVRTVEPNGVWTSREPVENLVQVKALAALRAARGRDCWLHPWSQPFGPAFGSLNLFLTN